MAEVRNFETLVQNEGLDPIGEIQTYIYIYIGFAYRRQRSPGTELATVTSRCDAGQQKEGFL